MLRCNSDKRSIGVQHVLTLPAERSYSQMTEFDILWDTPHPIALVEPPLSCGRTAFAWESA